MSPTQRTLQALREQGLRAVVVERWNPYAKIRQDLFGILDIIALDTAAGVTRGVQCTSDAHVAERVAKILESGLVPELERCGWKIEVWGWAKKGPRGKRKLWQSRVVPITRAIEVDQSEG